MLGKVLLKIQHRDHPQKKSVIHFDRLKPYIHSSKREEHEVLPHQRPGNGKQEDDIEIEIVPGKRPDQRQNNLVDDE